MPDKPAFHRFADPACFYLPSALPTDIPPCLPSSIPISIPTCGEDASPHLFVSWGCSKEDKRTNGSRQKYQRINIYHICVICRHDLANTYILKESKMKTTASNLIRWAGLCAIGAGSLFIVIQAIHPLD